MQLAIVVAVVVAVAVAVMQHFMSLCFCLLHLLIIVSSSPFACPALPSSHLSVRGVHVHHVELVNLQFTILHLLRSKLTDRRR